MPHPDQVLPQCRERFEASAQHLGRIETKLDRLCQAVLGNGDPKNSLASRVTRLEATGEAERQTTDRGWKAIAILASVLAVAISAYQALAK